MMREHVVRGLSRLPKEISRPILAFYDTRFLHYLFSGGTGTLITLLLTWIFTTYVFGLPRYFLGYLSALCIGLSYDFLMHTFVTYKTKKHHAVRLPVFLGYMLVLNGIQAIIVRLVTPVFGNEWYLVVIASVIAFFALMNFFFLKKLIFKDWGI